MHSCLRQPLVLPWGHCLSAVPLIQRGRFTPATFKTWFFFGLSILAVFVLLLGYNLWHTYQQNVREKEVTQNRSRNLQ